MKSSKVKRGSVNALIGLEGIMSMKSGRRYSLPGPLASRALVSLAVRLVQVGNLGHERVIGIWVGQHGADREQHLGDGERWAPLVPENVETDAAVAVDVGVVDLGGEGNLGGLEGVVGRESDGEEEDTAGVRGVTGAHDRCLPLEHVVAGGTSAAGRGRITAEVGELLVDSLHSHFLRATQIVREAEV